MASTTETGHAINIANFKLLIDYCTELGTVYSPPNAAISLTRLNTVWNAAKAAHDTLNNAAMNAKEPVNQREELFKPLEKLVTRSLNLYLSTGASNAAKEDAKGLANKIRGRNIKVPRDAAGKPDPNYVSNSQQSYVQRTNAFKQLLALLGNDAGNYTTTDAELQLTALNAVALQMEGHNEQVGNILSPVVQARGVRNNHLYTEGKGMVDLAQLVKKFCKSLPAEHGEMIRKIQGIKFTRGKV